MPENSYAIVTPYHKETRRTLERCLSSVKRQTIRADHIVVADGLPQEWLDSEPVRHIQLDRSHGDFGNTPRGLGALLAVSDGYDGIGFLDADNWLADDHIERCVEAARRLTGGDCDFVVASRYFMRPDGTTLDFDDRPATAHMDANCLFLFEGSYHLLHHWVTIPRQLSIAAEHIFFIALTQQNLRSSVAGQKTIHCECLRAPVYLSLGEIPPPQAKPPVDPAPLFAWLQSLSDRELQVVNRLCGSISWRSLHMALRRNPPW